MPKTSKAKAKSAPENIASAGTAEQPKLTKSEVVRQALKAHARKAPKEIAELLQAQGLDVSSAFVSQIKFYVGQKKGKKKTQVVAAPEAAPALPKDAVSIALLQKAKKLAKDLGGIEAAKQALDALAQLMD
jgi:hypothetical protein